MIRSGLILASGNIGASVLGFVRNIALARLLSVHDYGIASTFMIAAAILEMLSNLAVDRMIVQAKDGDDVHFLNALHGLALIRAAVNATALYLLSWPIAALFGHQEIVWAYQIVALLPLLRGLGHNGIMQRQRRMNFGPMALSQLTGGLVTLLAVWPLTLWLEDYRVMLAVLLIQAMVSLGFSHGFGGRPYRIAFDRSVITRAFSFGGPLLVSNLLIFTVMQGDRIVVGNQLGPEALGLFSAALTLAMTPSLVADRTLRSFFLPLLSKAQDDRARFHDIGAAVLQVITFCSAGMAALLLTFGPWLFLHAYGARYAGGLDVFFWLVLVFSIRLARVSPVTIAMAKGQTGLSMIASAARAAALPLGFFAAFHGSDMSTVVAIGLGGEILAVAVSAWMLIRSGNAPGGPRVIANLCWAAAVFAIGIWIAAAPGTGPAPDLRHALFLPCLFALGWRNPGVQRLQETWRRRRAPRT